MDKDVFDENGNYKKVSLLKQVDSHSGLNIRALETVKLAADREQQSIKEAAERWNKEGSTMDKDLKSMPEKAILDRSMFGETSGGVHYIRADLCNPRATDCPAVDFEALKLDESKYGEGGENYAEGWNECLNYLASRNVFRGAAEPIEGLEEAIKDYDFNGQNLMDYKNIEIIIKAAKKYHEMTKGGNNAPNKNRGKLMGIDNASIKPIR